MAELKWIKVHLFLILGLQFTVCTITGSSVFIRSGDDLVLSCQHVISGQINCNGTTWVYSDTSSSVELVHLGKVKNVQSKSNRLSLAANCSLVMRNITVKDAGYYECLQYKSGAEPRKRILVNKSGVSLSVVHMSEQKVTDVVTLICSVASRGHCGYTVKWLTDCSTGKPDLINCPTQHSGCSAAVCFKEHSYTQSCEFKCEITNHETTRIFNFNHQYPEDKSGKTTCNPTREAEDVTSVLAVRNSLSSEGIKMIVFSLGLVALSGTVLVVHIWIKIKGNKTWTVKNKVDAEFGVSYASIRHPKINSSKVLVCGDLDTVTYSTLTGSGSRETMKQRGAMEDPMWRKMFLFFILQFTGAQSRDLSLSYTVRAGDDVTLSCENVINGHSKCDTTTWIYTKTGRPAVELVNLGQVKVTRSDRLSVSANCSLVVKNVTDEDLGLYGCRQFVSGSQSGSVALVHLSLVHLTEYEDQNKMILTCSVVTDEPCKHSVKWLFQGKYIDKNNTEITESSSFCSAAVIFHTSHYIYQSRFNMLKCEVKTENKVQVFTFSSRPSEKDKTTTTSAVPTVPDETSAIITTNTSDAPDVEQKPAADWWRFLSGSVGLAVLIAAVLIVNIWARTKGRKTHLDKNAVCYDEDEAALNYENIRTSSV
ncbi:uncharacterized protein LOC122825841 [Gambusia affinis]|uniref:uncharacterized protein LOC122825841 n=1 Tax=Gambusia affinis TaxID=33528 RepID=UPI001CDD6CE0|nr:uncharacterized protein LOC122825841 [Gambusia affinis]